MPRYSRRYGRIAPGPRIMPARGDQYIRRRLIFILSKPPSDIEAAFVTVKVENEMMPLLRLATAGSPWPYFDDGRSAAGALKLRRRCNVKMSSIYFDWLRQQSS